MTNDNLTVVKVGGSLFSLPELGPGLRRWLAEQPGERFLLVPGGGDLADAVRGLHRVHGLGDEVCHWLALRTLSVTARFLAHLLPGSEVVEDARPDALAAAKARVRILDGLTFAEADDARPGRLERSWDVTSDSIAARAAEVSGAGRLVLLKSVAMEPFAGWEDASARGWVDAAFPRVLAAAMRSRPLRAEAVPFPDWLARWRGE